MMSGEEKLVATNNENNSQVLTTESNKQLSMKKIKVEMKDKLLSDDEKCAKNLSLPTYSNRTSKRFQIGNEYTFDITKLKRK